MASERATRALADEQAALRRIATLVASEAAAELGVRAGHRGGRAPARRAERERAALRDRRARDGRRQLARRRADGPAARARRSTSTGTRSSPGSTAAAQPERIDNYDDAPRRARRAPARARLPVVGGGPGLRRRQAVGRARRLDHAVRAPGRAAPSGGCRDFAELVAQALSNADAYDKLAASRARIVEAGDAERRRLERNLHDGAQQRLVSLALQLRMVEASLEANPGRPARISPRLASSSSHALEELRELARGIHPAILTDGGLAPALSALAHRAPVPVEIDDVPDERLPEPVEAAAYYLIAEAITNVAKHAQASHVAVERARATTAASWSASPTTASAAPTPAAGSGLHGLADRVEALHGHLRVDSPPGGGTRLEARIPVG